MNISVLGENIKRLREAKGINPFRLSKLAGVGTATVAEIESGVRQSLRSDTIQKIASALEVSEQKLFEVEGEYIVSDLLDVVDFIFEDEDIKINDISLTPIQAEAIKNELMLTIKNFAKKEGLINE
ncbi:helix-turn-helix domain-containing protein [Clostridium gasigenes]|uniref:helix-turn-helix domain-containing protein n=1 Tax=Clostridium gasigenes TaxID=94869 RepID=UPI001C0E53C8|nr:helix-turn-helix transcriptional regulator [Clostridium gasigenes]MBU3107183.1 helix-turn-helix domain-containing protein [Clostridium gasigenes]